MKTNIKFLASYTAPDPMEVMYWVDLSENVSGKVIKCYEGNQWVSLTNYKNKFEELEKQIKDNADATARALKELNAKVDNINRAKRNIK